VCEPASAESLRAEGFSGVSVGTADFYIGTWLMSCRVLGRQVEEAMMNVVAEQARGRGTQRLLGHYVPTAKNAMVREHYERLGFALLETTVNGATLWALDLAKYRERATEIACFQGELASV
jgi:predicted enzyme involved in methoxymalonyl-ACP biosynthesis